MPNVTPLYQTYNSNNNGHICLLAAPYYLPAIVGWGTPVFGYLVEPRDNKTITKLFCITGWHSIQEFGENCSIVNYWWINSITVRDTFPLPQIEKALLDNHSSNEVIIWSCSGWPAPGHRGGQYKTPSQLDLQISVSLFIHHSVSQMWDLVSFIWSSNI